MRVRFVTVGLAALLSAACDEDVVTSEAGGFTLQFAGLHSERFVAWAAPYRVVVGTRLCPQARCAACEADDACAAVAVTGSGAVRADGDCFVADAPGAIEWRVGAPCDDADAPGDRATMTVLAADELSAAPVLWPEQLQRSLAAPTQGAFVSGTAAPLRVIAGSQVRLDVRLAVPDGGAVGWSDGEVAVARASGRAPVVYSGDALELVTFAGGVADASFRVGDSTWPMGQVIGVPESEARSLELGVMFVPGEGGTTPAVGRARVRDADGRELLGAPVTWSIEGSLALAVDAQLPGPEWISIADACLPPEARGGPRSAELRAEVGDLAATLELRWDGVVGDPDPKWEKAEHCGDDGCGCRSHGGGFGWCGVLALLRRRRR